MKMFWQGKYNRFFIYSFLLHILLFLSFVFSYASSAKPQIFSQTQRTNVKIVKAVAIDQAQVDAQIKAITYTKQKEAQQAKAKQKALEKQLKRAKAQRIAQQRQLKKLQAQQRAVKKKMQQERLAAQKNLARIKKQTAQAKKMQQQAKARALAAKKKADAAAKRRQQALAAKKRQQAKLAAQKAAAAKAAALKKQQAQQQAQVNQKIISRYTALILQSIRNNWNVPPGLTASLHSTFEIKLSSDGRVIAVKLINSSGNAALDRSARTAIYKASPLPLPDDKQLAKQFSDIVLKVSPQGGIGV